MARNSQELGTDPIGKILVKMAVPASVGILVMSIYSIVDTIFVGRWVGTLGIAAITVVMPISFLIASIGMAIGVGGSSIISRALGADDDDKADRTLGNMATLTILLAVVVVGLGFLFDEAILKAFGGKGDILTPARTYFRIVLLGIPGLAWAMMCNNVMRAEGAPRMAMVSMLVPAIANLILDPIFIAVLDMGMAGAAWATTISYYLSASFTFWFFFSGRSDLSVKLSQLWLKVKIVREIFSIGIVTLARQGTISLFAIVLNQSLFSYGGELGVAIFGIINRLMMFMNFPVLGITQGFLPIAGYNYGAENWRRVKAILYTSIQWGSVIAISLFLLIFTFSEQAVALFTTDEELLRQTPRALVITFSGSFLIATQLISAAYFQAIGKATPALLLTMTKQGFFLIPLVLSLPLFFGLDGIWFSFPIADVLAASVTFWYVHREIQRTLNPRLANSELVPTKAAVELER